MDYAACTHPVDAAGWEVVGVSGVDRAAGASVMCDWVDRGASWFGAIVACPFDLVEGVVGSAHIAGDVGWCALRDVDCTWASSVSLCLPWIVQIRRWYGSLCFAMDQRIWILLRLVV